MHMKKIQYTIYKRETGNASGKAKADAFDIAERLGFASSYNPSSKRPIRIVQQYLSLGKFKDKIVFFQYPAVSEQLMTRYFHSVRNSDTVTIGLVHDLESIQGVDDWNVKKEIGFIRNFDYLIVHNSKMEEYVRKIGYKGKTIDLGVFDYLCDFKHPIYEGEFSYRIAFAGNLEKASFTSQLKSLGIAFNLYGKIEDPKKVESEDVKYKGLLPSDQIQYLLTGDYGLVWDGNSIESCSGIQGEYLKYNDPHKLSLYIAAGKPVITWKKAAIADFIAEHQIGFTVNSLTEITKDMLAENYSVYKQNVMALREKVTNGYYLTTAVNTCLKDISRKG